MADPKVIVNKLIEAEPDPDSPEQYLDWLGQKVDTGPLDKIRFGAYIYTTDEDTIRQNAEESHANVDTNSDEFWEEVERNMAIIEANALRILREAGLHVSDEGHNENARVASVWIDTDEEDRRLALLKAVISWAEGDWPSTTSGTMDYAFGANTTSDLYANCTEAARWIDVTIEFTGTEALVEWSKLNLNEAIEGDPDDPQVFLRSYMPRMLGALFINFDQIKPHFPDAPANWRRDRADGMHLFRYERVSGMREILRQMRARSRERVEAFRHTFEYKVDNPAGSTIVQNFLKQNGASDDIIEWAKKTNAPIWFHIPVKEFKEYIQMVYPQIKVKEAQQTYRVKPGETYWFEYRCWESPHSQDAPLWYRSHQQVQVLKLEEPGIGADEDQRAAEGCPAAYQVRFKDGFTGTAMEDELLDSREHFINADPPKPVKEADEDADPEAYLDAVTGWIDTFVRAGMTSDTSEGHEGQWWKKWRLAGMHYWIIVRVRRPMWMQVLVNDALYGTNRLQRTFEFRHDYQNQDQKELVDWFQRVDKLINEAVRHERDQADIVERLNKRIEAYHDDFTKRMYRRRMGEAVDDPEVQHYLDKVTPEQCLHCGNDLTQRHTVVRVYYDRNQRSHELSGHYEGSEGYWTNDEQPSANLIAILPNVATFDDICQRCGTNTARPMRHEESEAFDPEADVRRYTGRQHDLTDIFSNLTNYGLAGNRIEVFGNWVIIYGYNYWQTTRDDQPLRADFFREQIDKYMAELGIKMFKAQIVGDYPEGIRFKLAIHKTNLDWETWYHFKAIKTDDEQADIDRSAREWLPEDNEDYKADALRLMAAAPMRYNELRKWRPYIHVPRDNFHNPENYYFTTLIVPVFTATGRLSKAHSWHGWLRMKEFTYDNPPTWEQRVAAVNALVPRYLPGFFPDKLRKRGFQVGVPYEPYEGKFYTTEVQEAVDPDDPSVNIERHMASMDIDQIMQRLGFSERKPTWNCCDPEYRWFEKFVRGTKWTVIRSSDMEPHIFEVAVYKLGGTQIANGLTLPDYQQIGAMKVHVGELEARLRTALRGRKKVAEGVDLPPEDDPADALERFAKHTEQVEQDALDSAIDMAVEEFETRVRLGSVLRIKDADQLAAEVGDQFASMAGYANGTDEYDMIVSAVNNKASEMFPSPEEPQMEAKAVQWTPERVRDMVYNMFVQDGDLTQKEAETYVAGYTQENANQLYQICVEINRNIVDDAKIAQLTGIAVNLIRQANADYAATLRDMTKHIKVDEAVDPDDPETTLRHTPIQVRAWAVGFHGQHQTQVDFDAGPYFDALANEENGLETMISLAKEGFAMSNDADRVAAWFSDTTLRDFFKNNTEMGYETHMSQNDVKRWVEHNKPDWYPYLWPKDTQVDKGYDIAEAVDPDDPEAYVRSMETDWRKILRKHGWKPDPHGEHLHFTLEFPDLVWKRPVRVWATHGWAEPPEFHYEHPDPDDPDIDAEDAAYNEWLKQPGNDEFERIRNRDVAFPDYVVFQFDIESYRRIEVPVGKLDTFCARFVREAKKIVGTETVAKVHAGQGLVQMLWDKGREIARGLQIPLRESDEPQVPVPPEDEPGDVIKQHEKGLLLPELERLGFTSRRERGAEWVYGDEIPRWWYKVYNEQTKHALYVYFWGGQTPEVQASVYDSENKKWFRSGSEDPARAPAQSQAHLAAIVRDLDAAMLRMDPLNLSVQEQFEAIERVVIHHRKWWDDTLDYLIKQGNTLPGRMGPGQPA